jgi:hypothetical protein
MVALLAAGAAACTRPNPAFYLDDSLEIPRDGPPAINDGPGSDRTGGSGGGGPATGGQSGSGGASVDPALDAATPDADATPPPPPDAAPETNRPPDVLPDGPPEVAGPDADLRTSAGLQAHFPFDRQPAGSTTTDSFGNMATFSAAIRWSSTTVPPVTGGAQSIQFDGAGAFVELTLPDTLVSSGNKTLALWYSSTRNTPTERTLIALYNEDEGLNAGVQLGFNGTQLAAWRWGQPPNDLVATASTPGWHHAAYTYDGTTHRLYLDGLQQVTATGHAFAPGAMLYLDRCKLGTYDQGLENQKYQGFMQDLRIYNRPLSPAEIRTLAGLPP